MRRIATSIKSEHVGKLDLAGRAKVVRTGAQRYTNNMIGPLSSVCRFRACDGARAARGEYLRTLMVL